MRSSLERDRLPRRRRLAVALVSLSLSLACGQRAEEGSPRPAIDRAPLPESPLPESPPPESPPPESPPSADGACSSDGDCRLAPTGDCNCTAIPVDAPNPPGAPLCAIPPCGEGRAVCDPETSRCRLVLPAPPPPSERAPGDRPCTSDGECRLVAWGGCRCSAVHVDAPPLPPVMPCFAPPCRQARAVCDQETHRCQRVEGDPPPRAAGD